MSQLIIRHEALSHCSLIETTDFRILLIQAQAGQGKTVLATQFEKSQNAPFVWISCTRNDNSSRLLLDSIINSLIFKFSEFPHTSLYTLMKQQFTEKEFIELATKELCNVLANLEQPIYFVFDDVHVYDNDYMPMCFFKMLVENSPKYINFIFISRFPLQIEGQDLFDKTQTLQIDNSLLAFTREEIAMLYNDILGEAVGTRRIKALYEATDGWITGLKLLHVTGSVRRMVSADSFILKTYFDELLIPALTPVELKEIIKLSLLEELPKDMLEEFVSPPVLRWIEELVANNCFIREGKNKYGTFFMLHHIFQEYLACQVDQEISVEEKVSFLQSVGEWWLKSDNTIIALRCLVKAQAWQKIEDVFKEQLLLLLGFGHHQFINEMLNYMPEKVIRQSGWLSFALGSARFAIAPSTAEYPLSQAVELFQIEKDFVGELLALCSLLNFHAAISNDYRNKGHQVTRAAQLYELLERSLPGVLAVNCAQSLAVGKSYFEGKLLEAHSYIIRTGTQYAQCEPNSVPWYDLINIILYLFEGNTTEALYRLSSLLGLANSPLISPIVRFTVIGAYANALIMHGATTAFVLIRNEILHDWKPFIKNSRVGVDLITWEMDMLNAKGLYREAYALGENSPLLQKSLYTSSQSYCYLYQAISLACLGRIDEMKKSMRTGLRLRAKSGGYFYIHLSHALAMAALTIAGKTRNAKCIFAKCTKPRNRAGNFYQDPLLYSCMAAIHLKEGNQEAALTTTEVALGTMKKHGSYSFFGWTPIIMKQILPFAVKNKIYQNYARILSKKRFNLDILDDGSTVDLLQISDLGRIQLKLLDKVLDQGDLTKTWEQFLRKMALTPGMPIAIDEIQQELWPEEDAVESRTKFDTMLSRFRSKFSNIFGRNSARKYIVIKAGKCTLVHSRSESSIVLKLAREGCAHAESGRSWLAHTTFSEMGEHIGEPFVNNDIQLFLPEQLALPVERALMVWAELLNEVDKKELALSVVNKGLSLAPLNEQFHRLKYNLLTDIKKPQKAAQAIRNYRELLHEHDFGQEEISQIIDTVLGC